MWSSQFIWPSNLPMFGLPSACPHSLLKKKKICLFLIVCVTECVHVCLVRCLYVVQVSEEARGF